MEYCEKLNFHGMPKKPLIKAFGTVTAAVVVIGTAGELPGMDYAMIRAEREAYIEEQAKQKRQPAANAFDGKRAKGVLMDSSSAIGIQKGSLEDLLGEMDFVSGKRWKELLSSSRGGIRAGKLSIYEDKIISNRGINKYIPDSAQSEYPETELSGQEAVPTLPREEISVMPPSEGNVLEPPSEGVVPGTPAESIVPDTPQENIVPDVPQESIVPDIPQESIVPDVPQENIVPDVPQENIVPDVPQENIVPDVPQENITPDVPQENIVPDVPQENIVPDIPQENITPDVPQENITPDTPQENIVPDTPGEETSPTAPPDLDTGNTDVLLGFEVNGDRMIYNYLSDGTAVEDGGYLRVPTEGCSGILSGTFSSAGAGIYDICIPANITYIEENAFSGLEELYGIDVEEGNPNYASEGGVMFDKSRTVLLAFPKARIGTYGIPGGITALADYAFADTSLSKLDMRGCGKLAVGDALFGESDGNGMVIMVPKEYLAEYQEIFAGYNVVIQ